MDKTTALRATGVQATFRFRAQGLVGDALRMALAEAVVNLNLSDEEESVFLDAAKEVTVIFGQPETSTQPTLLVLN